MISAVRAEFDAVSSHDAFVSTETSRYLGSYTSFLDSVRLNQTSEKQSPCRQRPCETRDDLPRDACVMLVTILGMQNTVPMRPVSLRLFALALLVIPSLAGVVRADVAIPDSILNPKTAAESWNVIRLATRNVEQLLEENRLPEVPAQISFSSPSLRALANFLTDEQAIAHTQSQVQRAFISVNAIAAGAQQGNPVGAKSALSSLRSILDGITRHFDPKVVGADIFLCPAHPDFVSGNPKTPCATCGAALIPRRIPYSFIYMKPGEPTVRVTATASAPIEAGKALEVKVRIAKADRSPLTDDDLLVMHAERIRLLIEEPGLGDFHHVIPARTKTPGEYTFSFTPKKSAPYRLWADLLPTATGVQELPFVDLAPPGKASAIEDKGNQFTSAADGYQFALAFTNGNHLPTKAGVARKMEITVTAADGKPVTSLEPVMNAFAHLVGFYDDHRTVVQLHPTGGDVLNPDLRGGPTLGFVFFVPKPGFVRLYCQVKIDGKMLFAPFSVNVEP
jgi:hypothetical protein